ncbi:MAG: FAD-dependent oxidoreductase [Alphaproteobacteria bacterium]|nr:FAD-dependent oxidoreductase [Alphaproteobacteria bacterium]
MQLGLGFTFESLHQPEALVRLDAAFLRALEEADAGLHRQLLQARAAPQAVSEKQHSALLLAVAPHAEEFIARFFGVEAELMALRQRHYAKEPLYACKRLFVQRRAARAYTPQQAELLDGDALAAQLTAWFGAFDEALFAKHVMAWLEAEEAHRAQVDVALRYAAWALLSAAGRARHRFGVLFKQPRKLEYQHLVEVEAETQDGVAVLHAPPAHRRRREGFALTDPKGTLAQALDQTHYCIYCHHQEKDSCRRGFRERDGSFRENPLGIPLTGCPLDEKISEMNELKSEGFPIGALAVVVIDNPLCAGTGHRICNDCMKSCIYQKQEPVNIPMAETRVLDDVLALPYGVEIYALLTRWNPLNIARPLPRPESGYRVLVVGLGPAGYTLSHYLLNDGHGVLAVDGLKIEPLDKTLLTEPVRDFESLRQRLDERSAAGFGGVAEYGITVRWDKNYLTLIRLILERREHFRVAGGVRFGSALTYDDAFALGFDHIALCMGAGSPNLLPIPNGLARGVRMASDFLMSLQLTGAAKMDSVANLQLRLPAVVIGGGLTAIDTATEALAYYPVQVEKFLQRYERLAALDGEAAVRSGWNEEEALIADEFLAHARALHGAEDKAALVQGWGGVKIVYRKRLVDAPSYRLNHEEVEKAFEEGIGFSESLEPEAVEVDRFGHASALRLKYAGGKSQVIPAHTILVAAGTHPNTVLAQEDPAHFPLDGQYFQAVDEEGNPVRPARTPKPEQAQVLLARPGVSFFGDLHPSYAGNVVRAMASAKQGYAAITRQLEKQPPHAGEPRFLDAVAEQLAAVVREVRRLTPAIVEVVVHAPLAAARFQPGQFYRLQNLERYAAPAPGAPLPTTLAMEGLAMTGAWVDKARGLVSVIVLEMGGSSDLCALLRADEPVVLMGPTGAPTEIPPEETVLLAGGGLGNAVLFSIGRAFRERGGRVLYFAAYRRVEDRFYVAEIEAAADCVVWCCEEAPFAPSRPGDKSFHGNIIQAMAAYTQGRLGDMPVAFPAVRRIIAIGSDGMMAAVKQARHGVLKPYLSADHVAVGSINSPMQCMMKGICAQCLQEHRDPVSGDISYVYSCFGQDQALDCVHFPHLRQRLNQNAVQEKLTARWVEHCLPNLS